MMAQPSLTSQRRTARVLMEREDEEDEFLDAEREDEEDVDPEDEVR